LVVASSSVRISAISLIRPRCVVSTWSSILHRLCVLRLETTQCFNRLSDVWSTPRADSVHYNDSAELLNIMLKRKFRNIKNILLCDNSNMSLKGTPKSKLLDRDGYHLNEEGVTILASNITVSLVVVSSSVRISANSLIRPRCVVATWSSILHRLCVLRLETTQCFNRLSDVWSKETVDISNLILLIPITRGVILTSIIRNLTCKILLIFLKLQFYIV
jgi:hypothetical protein